MFWKFEKLEGHEYKLEGHEYIIVCALRHIAGNYNVTVALFRQLFLNFWKKYATVKILWNIGLLFLVYCC